MSGKDSLKSAGKIDNNQDTFILCEWIGTINVDPFNLDHHPIL